MQVFVSVVMVHVVALVGGLASCDFRDNRSTSSSRRWADSRQIFHRLRESVSCSQDRSVVELEVVSLHIGRHNNSWKP